MEETPRAALRRVCRASRPGGRAWLRDRRWGPWTDRSGGRTDRPRRAACRSDCSGAGRAVGGPSRILRGHEESEHEAWMILARYMIREPTSRAVRAPSAISLTLVPAPIRH